MTAAGIMARVPLVICLLSSFVLSSHRVRGNAGCALFNWCNEHGTCDTATSTYVCSHSSNYSIMVATRDIIRHHGRWSCCCSTVLDPHSIVISSLGLKQSEGEIYKESKARRNMILIFETPRGQGHQMHACVPRRDYV